MILIKQLRAVHHFDYSRLQRPYLRLSSSVLDMVHTLFALKYGFFLL